MNENGNGIHKENGSVDKDKILAKVQKLLKLAGGTTFNAEAETALSLAGELLGRYGMELSDVQSIDDVPDRIERANVRGLTHRRRSWESILANGIAKSFRSRAVIFHTWDLNADKDQWNIAFFGLPSDLILVKYFYDYLRFNIGRRSRVEFPSDVAGRNSFSLASASVVVERLERMNKIRDKHVPVNCRDLVPVVEKEVDSKVEADFGKLKKCSPATVSDRDGWIRGERYGKQISLSRPLPESGTRKHIKQ